MQFFKQFGKSRTEAAQQDASTDEARSYIYGARGGGIRRPGPSAPAPEISQATRDALSRKSPLSAPEPPTEGVDLGPWALNISAAANITGLLAACLVDGATGLLLTSEGSSPDMEAEAAFSTQVIRAQQQVIETLELEDAIEDPLVTTDTQLQILQPLTASPAVFLYVVLDRKAASLAAARMQAKRLANSIKV